MLNQILNMLIILTYKKVVSNDRYLAIIAGLSLENYPDLEKLIYVDYILK